MSDIYIAGVGMTHFGKHLERSLKDLTGAALAEVLADAGCEGGQIEAAFFGNCVQGHMEGQDMVRGEIALRAHGIQGIPVVNVENACATASTAFHMAVNYVQAGAADIVLAIGVEKMFSEDKARMFSAFDGAWDVHDVDAAVARFAEMAQGVEIPEGSTSPRPYSVFMDIYAGFCRMHMRDSALPRPSRRGVRKNHVHSTKNPKSQYQRPYTVEEIFAAAPITFPLTLPMCSPISDGAAAAIVCNAAGLKRLAGTARDCRVLASVMQSGSNRGSPSSRSTRAAWPRRRPMPRPASGRKTWISPKSMTPRRWARSSNWKHSGCARSATADRPRHAARPASAGVSRSIPPVGSSPRGIRSGRPASARSTNSCCSSAARPMVARSRGPGTPSRRTAVAWSASRTRSPAPTPPGAERYSYGARRRLEAVAGARRAAISTPLRMGSAR